MATTKKSKRLTAKALPPTSRDKLRLRAKSERQSKPPRAAKKVSLRETVRRVFGLVLASDGSTVTGLLVDAFDSDLSGKNFLGTAEITNGKYEIRYAAAAYRTTDKEKGGPELFLRVRDANDRILCETPIKRNAGVKEEINIVVPARTLSGSNSPPDAQPPRSAPGRRLQRVDTLALPRLVSHSPDSSLKPGKAIGEIHAALQMLGFEISRSELARKEAGSSTLAALSEFRKKAELPEAKLAATVEALNAQIAHRHVAASKGRTERLQTLLQQAGQVVDEAELRSRQYGPTTQRAVSTLQRSFKQRPDGLVTSAFIDSLHRAALATRLSTKSQATALQQSLVRAGQIAKLDVHLDAKELRQGTLGASTVAMLKAFQTKYKLPVTGEADPKTVERIVSVVASVPKATKLLKAPRGTELRLVKKSARLNMTGNHVADVQATLAFLGHKIDEAEYRSKRFGGTTQKALISYQAAAGLPITGHADTATLKRLNREVTRANPASRSDAFSYRIKGSVRDELWRGIAGARVEVWERLTTGEGAKLAERRALGNGFFDIAYDPPRDVATKQIKTPFHLLVKAFDGDAEIGTRVLFNPTQIDWANFTKGDQPYRGISQFDDFTKALSKVLGGTRITDLVESEDERQVSQAAQAAGLTPDQVLRLVLAHRVAASLGTAHINPEVCYAYIAQNLPSNLPSDLLGATVEWNDELVNRTGLGLVFMDAELQATAFDNAITLNLMPIAVGRQKDALLQAFSDLAQKFALEKPILVGSGTLKGLLATTTVTAASYAKVADTFLKHRSFGESFWADVSSRPDEFGGKEALADLQATIQIGQVTKNFTPMLSATKGEMANRGLGSPRELAKLTPDEWEAVIIANGNQVPSNTDGGSVAEKVATYAATLANMSERLFPDVALVAEIKRSDAHSFAKVPQIQALMDANPDLNLRNTNIDAYVASKEELGDLDADTLAETRALQRINRLAPSAKAGRILAEKDLHSSAKIIALGPERFIAAVTKDEAVDATTARTMYQIAEMRYGEVMMLLTDFRFDMHRADPTVIVDHTYTKEELSKNFGVPSLETLFGSLDYCACEHCRSVYGPAAYLADLLRYLSKHLSEVNGKTVAALLFERRPDIQMIKLNCRNTDTPLPYVDLVNEVLEHAVSANAPADRKFAFQSTKPAADLRAAPENLLESAYDTLRTASTPIHVAFDLWQEQARAFLRHLGVARWELMEALQSRGAPMSPLSSSIAGEYFGISTHAVGLIVAAGDATDAKQKLYWDFDANPPQSVSVADFMRRSALTYQQLLELLYVEWLNPGNAANPMAIERPEATCDTNLQNVVNLTLARWDKIHRFLRLWRHTHWEMWELDLLLRAPKVGAGTLDANCLAALHKFAQLQGRLGLSVERALVLFGTINKDRRVRPEAPQESVPALYQTLFLNQAVINPVDPAFNLPLAAAKLADHKGAILAAVGISDADWLRLSEGLPDDDLTVENLSQVARYAWLGRSLGLSVKHLLNLASLSATDPFGSPKEAIQFIEELDWATATGATVDELDYLLRVSADSALGLREEVIAQYGEALREAIRSDKTGNSSGVAISQIASTLALTPDQSQVLVGNTTVGAKKVADILVDPALLQQDAGGKFATAVSKADFPDLFTAYQQLHKASLVVRRFKLDAKNLAWLLTNAAAFSLLKLHQLPVSAPPGAKLLSAWLNLAKFVWFKNLYPEPESSTLRGTLDDAAAPAIALPAIKAALTALTQWEAQEVTDLITALGLAKADLTKIDNYVRMHEARRVARRVGVSIATASAWAARDVEAGNAQRTAAQEARQAAKAKYDSATWLEKLTPIEDELREKKRDALTWHLIARSHKAPATLVQGGKTYANPEYFREPDHLLNYYLIDVQMCACQLTSRIKQAISSVQMFVQRCLLGLEQPRVEVSRAEQQDSASANSWKQWRWMKNYRLWEANRKVFLYPENWIEPDLRDDKSPFFEELESELLQAEITDAKAETALIHYLEKVHEVARLDIVGAHYEGPDNDRPDINRLHVIGRTRAQPSVYFYRRFDLVLGEWTPWKKIELDIQSDQIVPVVYNRRLYLFWLTFLEKPQKVKRLPNAQPANNVDNPEPPLVLEVQLAWSAQVDDGWTPKKISKQKLIHPWQRPRYSYNLKPRYKSLTNLLWMDVFITQSEAFNSTQFWDPYLPGRAYVTAHHPYVETARPWHSSSFVFDGEVLDVRMRGLDGQYHILDNNGVPQTSLSVTNSLRYVRDNFGEAGRAINGLAGANQIAPRLPLPDGMHYQNTKLVNNTRTLNANRANVLESSQTRTLLNGAIGPFEIVASQHRIRFDTRDWGEIPFFYQDPARAFFIRPELEELILGPSKQQTLQSYTYTFFPFYHPYTALFMRELKRSGVEGLLNRRIQTTPQNYFPGNGFDFGSYQPAAGVSRADVTAQKDRVDFERYGAYSLYNWELFFHAPLLIACKLSQNQRFEEALRWFHFIFDPTNVESADVPQRYWITRPFFERNSAEYRKQRIENLLKNIGANEQQLNAWKNNPFKPHLIARYRPVAYQKTVVMKYIDNLIAWGDQLFRRDTIEAINEATTLYVLAYEILGRRPVKVPNVDHADKSYEELVKDGELDPFGNKQVEVLLENFTESRVLVTRSQDGTEPLPELTTFYFGIPTNDQLLAYWDRVEDRLYKIRHCMNIQGVVRQLPLFEPPIDPALLVKAAAAGIDLSSALSDLAVPTAPYRFRTVSQKAQELCGAVRALGEKLLSVLEKSDGEALTLLRSTHELALLEAVRGVRKLQIKEALEAAAGLQQTRQLAAQRKAYYEEREFINPWEGIALALGGVSAIMETAISLGYVLAGGLSLIPKVTLGASGFGGSPHVTADPVDGLKLSKAAEGGVQVASAVARTADKFASLASTMGSYQRRQDDWTFQAQQATTEIAQIDRQIVAAEIRSAIAERELENQELQIEQSRTIDEYMRSKYTNKQLFDWHVRQVSNLYFQAYQMAYDMAKRAEKCFQQERADFTASFVQFGHWDSLKSGLLAGERLAGDLSRLDAAYLTQNTRDLELTKHVSLAQIFPLSLIALKEAGSCTVVLPEWLFDMDYPGHYFRRIKSVSLSIPCVVGPYTSVNSKLTLLKNGIRTSTSIQGGYGNPLGAADPKFNKSVVAQDAIATSHGQNDAGMFELNFNDERYLPFEGAGSVSEWKLELARDSNQFDVSTIADVVIHVRYTARDSGNLALIAEAKKNVEANLPEKGLRLLALNREFATEWHRFLHPDGDEDQTLQLKLGLEHLPFYARNKKHHLLTKVTLVADKPAGEDYLVDLETPDQEIPGIAMSASGTYGNRPALTKDGFPSNAKCIGDWVFKVKHKDAADFKSLSDSELGDVYLVLEFKATNQAP